MEKVTEKPLDRVLGLFSPAQVNFSPFHMFSQYCPTQLAYSGEQLEVDDPSLEEMTKAAIRMLANKEKGFVVFIEEVSNCPLQNMTVCCLHRAGSTTGTTRTRQGELFSKPLNWTKRSQLLWIWSTWRFHFHLSDCS